MNSRDVIRLIEAAGWQHVATKGSDWQSSTWRVLAVLRSRVPGRTCRAARSAASSASPA